MPSKIELNLRYVLDVDTPKLTVLIFHLPSKCQLGKGAKLEFEFQFKIEKLRESLIQFEFG